MAAKDFVWYVYELADAEGNVFYVGKGKGDRIEAHEKEARAGKQSHKCNKIRAIWDGGGKVVKSKVAFFCDEQQAYIHEADRIAEYGLGNLTNAVLCCSLVSTKSKFIDEGERAFGVIKALASHFAAYLRMTQGGKYKVKASGLPDLSRILTEKFYNDMAPKVVNRVLKSEKYTQKFIDLMMRHRVEVTLRHA